MNKVSYEECHKEINGTLYKQCRICREWVICSTENFYKNKSSTKDGVSPYCKTCESKKNSQWQKDNPDRVKAHNEREHKKPKVQHYLAELSKRRRENGKYQEWQRNNPDKLKQYHELYSNKKHKISKKEWLSCKEYFDNKCAYCGLDLDKHFNKFRGEMRLTDFHKEHVDCEGSDGLDNCIPSCKTCNTSKHKSTLEDWYNKENPKFKEDRLNKIHKWLNDDYKQYLQE